MWREVCTAARRLRRVQPVSRHPGGGSFGKLIGEQGHAEMGYHTPDVGVGVATWAIRREWARTHWRESANLMWRNLEHAKTGAFSEHAKTKAVHTAARCVGRRTPSHRDTPRERHQPHTPPHGAAAGVSSTGDTDHKTNPNSGEATVLCPRSCACVWLCKTDSLVWATSRGRSPLLYCR
jgi:hypothetical protein